MGADGRALTVLIAPDSFKGSLSSVAVAQALGDGWRRARPDDTILLSPLADGGEGTLAAVAAAGGWSWHTAEVTDPIGRPITARWLRSDDGTRAVVEMAETSGLSLLRTEERDGQGATSAGLGEVLRVVAASGVRDVIVGIGGSATTDAGFGMLAALGMATDPADPRPRGIPTPVGTVRLDELASDLGRVTVTVACDVSNPLLGPAGAAAVYGPQKGLTPDDVPVMDARIARFADRLDAASGRDERLTPGAGAAGGVGFALLSIQDRFGGFALRPGIDLVMDATDFAGKLARADVVLTGEGRIDAQTAFGKTALGVAQRAHAAGTPCIAVGGGVEPAGIDALAPLGVAVVPVVERPQTVEEAMAAGIAPLERCGERIGRLVSIL